MTQRVKSRLRQVCAWAAAAAGAGGLCWLTLSDGTAENAPGHLAAAGASVLLGGVSDSLYRLLCLFAPAVLSALFAALTAGMVWQALRLHGKTEKAAAWPSLIVTALASVAVLLGGQPPVSADTQALLQSAYISAAAVLLGGIGCIACIWLYGVLKRVFPRVLNHETVSYVVFGALTTVVSFVSQMIFHALGWETIPATVGSWICAVLFAYVVNKLFVFESHTDTLFAFFREMGLFFAARLASLGIEIVFMWLTVDILLLPDAGCKLAAQVIILVLNYIFSKLIIFRKRKPEKTE